MNSHESIHPSFYPFPTNLFLVSRQNRSTRMKFPSGGRGMRWIERRICRVSISTNLLIHAQLFKLKLLKSVKSIPLQRILVVRIGQLSVL